MSEAFTCGHASSPNWRDAAAQCLRQAGKGPRGANLGFLYVTDNFASELADMLAYFRTNTGIAHWSGTVGIGVIASSREYYDEPALAIMLCAFDDAHFRVFDELARSSGSRAPAAAFGRSACQLRDRARGSAQWSAAPTGRGSCGLHGKPVHCRWTDQFAARCRADRRPCRQRRTFRRAVFRRRRDIDAADAGLLAHRTAPYHHRQPAERHHFPRRARGPGCVQGRHRRAAAGDILAKRRQQLFAGLPIAGSATGITWCAT